jgi:hypothetical protein
VKKWRVKVKGSATATVDGKATKQPILENMEFESGAGGNVDIAVDIKVTWDEWKKSWRWGDYGWNSSLLGDIPFEYKAFWKGTLKGGAIEVAFVSSTDPKFEAPGGGTTLYEAKPSAQADTAVLTIVAYRDRKPMEVTARIKVKPPLTTPPPSPVWKVRQLVVDRFPRGKNTVTVENLKKIEDFWYSLTPETRTAVQNNELLNGTKVQITGHTSNTDKVPRNFDLGYERARAVADVIRKLSGNTQATNLAPMTKGERGNATDEPALEVEDAAQRKVVIELWEKEQPVSSALRKLMEILGVGSP